MEDNDRNGKYGKKVGDTKINMVEGREWLIKYHVRKKLTCKKNKRG